MFAIKYLSYKLASPILADLKSAKKVLRYLKGTGELNLYLTIPALKQNDLNKTLKTVTGHFDADWTDEPATRKSTSCTLCHVVQFFLTSECRGQGTVALSSGKSEVHALSALSAEFFRASHTERNWTIIPDTRESRHKHSTRSDNKSRSKSQDETHSHEIHLIQDLVFRKTADDVICQD